MASQVDYRETLITYLRSESIDDVLKTMNITSSALYYRLHKMRKAGVNIPKKHLNRSGLTALEVAQLNSLIKKYSK